jgi:SpoIID/LytB domain protein
MCQWGAYFLAKKRYKARDILKHYYPGAKITNIKMVNDL